ncbi:MAG: hypothetical protein ACLQF0_14495 [Dissulfurispiraceae bacterium]
MVVWKWEIFDSFLNEGLFSLTKAGSLYSPVNKFTIKRDEDLNIFIDTVSNHDTTTCSVNYPPGTVRSNIDSIEFENKSGIKAIAYGVQPLTNSRSMNETGTCYRHEKASIQNLECIVTNLSEGQYLIEWLVNVDDSYYIWPDSLDEEVEVLSNRIFCKNGSSLLLTSSEKTSSFSWKCVNISVDGQELYFGVCNKVAVSDEKMPGFVIYNGTPSEEIRSKIRLALSFAFGRPFIHLGHSIFNSKWQLVSFKSISAYTIDGKAFKLLTLPPSPLYEKFGNELNREKFSRMVNAFYKKYDDYNLGHVGWLYWHSVSAPIHIAAVHFGATFEAIQNAFVAANGSLFKTSVLEKTAWESLQKDILEVVRSKSINGDLLKIINNKIASLNQKPQSVLTEEFLGALNLQLSNIESLAWKQRNRAAHGSMTKEQDYIDLIKEVKLLKVLCHRVLLCITNGSDDYIDYYSIGFPIKKLQNSIEKPI